MCQIRFRLGLRPRPHGPLAGFEGPTSKGREVKEGMEGKEPRYKVEEEGKKRGRRRRRRGEGGDGRGKGRGMDG